MFITNSFQERICTSNIILRLKKFPTQNAINCVCLKMQQLSIQNNNYWILNNTSLGQKNTIGLGPGKRPGARYRIYFDNINLDSYPNALDTKKPKYYFLDHNYTLTEFPRSQLGPVLRYYDNLKDNYWVKSFPELQIQVNLTRDINIIYPPPSQSLKHNQLASNCICAKDLRENHFELKNSQRIVHDALSLIHI